VTWFLRLQRSEHAVHHPVAAGSNPHAPASKFLATASASCRFLHPRRRRSSASPWS